MFENFTQPRKQFTRVSLVTLVTNSTFVIRIYLYSYQVFLNVGHFDSRMDSWGHKEFTLSMNAVRTKYLYKCLFVGHVDSEMDSLKSWWWTANFVNCHQINKLKENTQTMSQKKSNDVYCHIRYIISSICTSAGGKLGTLLTFTDLTHLLLYHVLTFTVVFT